MYEFLWPLLASTLAGLIIGIERQWARVGTSLKTPTLVCIGATVFMIVGQHLGGDGPIRIVAQIVSGIGFLGAGVIMHEGANVKGLSTAATIWTAAGVGALAGIGCLYEAIVLALAIAVLNCILRYLSNFIDKHHHNLT